MPEMERDLYLRMRFKRRFATWDRFIPNSGSALIVIRSRRRYLFDDQHKWRDWYD